MKRSIKKLVAMASAGLMAMTLAVTAVPGTASATNVSKAGKQAAKKAFDPAGTYHAYFGLQQTESWIFRDEWYAEENGIGGTTWKKTDGLSFESGLCQSKDQQVTAIEGATVTDAEITGNGVYTVSVEGLGGVLSDAESENEKAVVSMLYVTTDIPMSAKDNPVVISDWKLKIDGNTQTLPANVFFPEEYTNESKLIRFDAVNTYQRDQGAYPECPSILAPRDSVQITFTVSGMANDNPDAVDPDTVKEDTSSAAGGDTSAASSESDSESSGGIGIGAVVAIVVVVVIVIAAIVVVATKKKKE